VVRTWLLFAKCIQEIKNSHLVLWIRGAVAIDHNVIGNDEIPSISSLVDDISKFRVYGSIQW
jgi:hypothetical protein